jgi:hypothetical protein
MVTRNNQYNVAQKPAPRNAMYQAISAYLNACARCTWLLMLALDDASAAFAQK